jgi:hypothetical protein
MRSTSRLSSMQQRSGRARSSQTWTHTSEYRLGMRTHRCAVPGRHWGAPFIQFCTSSTRCSPSLLKQQATFMPAALTQPEPPGGGQSMGSCSAWPCLLKFRCGLDRRVVLCAVLCFVTACCVSPVLPRLLSLRGPWRWTHWSMANTRR